MLYGTDRSITQSTASGSNLPTGDGPPERPGEWYEDARRRAEVTEGETWPIGCYLVIAMVIIIICLGIVMTVKGRHEHDPPTGNNTAVHFLRGGF